MATRKRKSNKPAISLASKILATWAIGRLTMYLSNYDSIQLSYGAR